MVEVETLGQLCEALDAGCERVLIDDFSAELRREAVRIARGSPYHGRIPLEVSGGVDLAGCQRTQEVVDHPHCIDGGRGNLQLVIACSDSTGIVCPRCGQQQESGHQKCDQPCHPSSPSITASVASVPVPDGSPDALTC